jgi:hypothetical protein
LSADSRPWANQFQIQSEVDLDFVIGQGIGYPVGMLRGSPPEFRRRILAGAISYQLQLKSVDYALKRYVGSDTYEDEDVSLGDEVSDYLRNSVVVLMKELRNLHTEHPAFGTFGAEITLYRLPHSLDTARMLSNRGLLLEVLPVLRLCLEMMAWSRSAFHMPDEEKVIALKAQSCISELKNVYETAGKLYGYLSTFSHWGHVIHGQFLDITPQQIGVLNASVRYRAMALALCLVILDVFVEVVRKLYPARSDALIAGVQGVPDRNSERKTHRMLARITELTELNDLREIQAFLE